METGNWKLETGKSKAANREARTDIPSSRFFQRAVSNFQFPVSSFHSPNRVGKLVLALATTFVTLAKTTALFGQSCTMCYNTAAAAKAAAIQALRSGILILLVPVALMFTGIFVLAFRSKERFTEFEIRNSRLETGNSPVDGESAFACEFPASNFEFRNAERSEQQ